MARASALSLVAGASAGQKRLVAQIRFGLALGRRTGDRLTERRPISVRRHELETLLRVVDEVVLDQQQRRHALDGALLVDLGRNVADGGHEQLERGQSLLAVDDEPRGLVNRAPRLGKDDRAHEVRHVVVVRSGVGEAIGDGAHVVPERLPLLFELPDVRSLVQRDHVSSRESEDLLKRERVGHSVRRAAR